MGQEMADVRQDVERYALRSTLLAPATADQAFAVFTGALADWWVREYTWSGPEALATAKELKSRGVEFLQGETKQTARRSVEQGPRFPGMRQRRRA